MKSFSLLGVMIFQLNAIQVIQDINYALARGDNDQNIVVNGELNVISHFIKKAMIVFDVGANVGEWSRYALRQCPEIDLFAFEPNPATFRSLEKSILSCSQTKAFCLGFGSCNERRPLFCWEPDKESVLSSLFQRPIVDTIMEAEPKTVDVQVQTLDSFCNAHNVSYIDFMKIDTEGSEWNVFLGAITMLKEKRIGVIQFEYGGCYTDAHTRLQDVYMLLKNFGYVIYKIIPEGLVEISAWDDRLESYRLSNYIASSVKMH